MNEPKYIAQGLLKTWKTNKDKFNCPLEHFLKVNYDRYAILCNRMGKDPVTFSKFLLKPVDTF